jgi:hypothetical protein
VNLVFDEMAIREQLIYCKGRFVGGVDLGTTDTQDNDTATMANNACVLMAVAINQHWKIPIGYFLIKSLTASEKATVIKQALHLPNEAKVYSITFDGLSSNLTMCCILGANLCYGHSDFKPYFSNPATNDPCFIFLDLCHMIKLIRNTLGHKQVLKCEGHQILWLFLQRLELLQRQEGLRAANKLTLRAYRFCK